jgi:putative ABC transport system permease protein
MTSKQLKAMLVYEGLFYALGSALVALILSFIMNPMIIVLLEKIFWFVSAKFTIIPVLIVVPIFALLGWLIPSIMYKQTSKHSIVERLREN